jgi:hypothetical protein
VRPDDIEFIQRKFLILTDFVEQLDDIIRPFDEQITEFIQRDFAFILEDTKVSFRPPYEELRAKKVEQEKDRIANSASYVLGLSDVQLRESNLI